MSEDEKKTVRDTEFRDELKGIMAEAIGETPVKQKLSAVTVLTSLGGVAIVIGFIATFAHLPKDIEDIHLHVGQHDGQILALVSGQAEIKEVQARTVQVSTDTNERVKRIEATLD